MKSFRDLILKRHQSAEEKLDRLWAESLGPALSQRRTPVRRYGVEVVRTWARTLWSELVWPCRRAWSGMAALCLVALALQWSAREPRLAGAVEARRAAPIAPATRLMLAEQFRLEAELLGLNAPPGVTTKSKSGQTWPRSDRVREQRLG